MGPGNYELLSPLYRFVELYSRFKKYPEHRSDLLRYLSLDSLDFNAAGAGGNFGDNNGDDDANEEGEEDDGDAYDDAETKYQSR